jgi:hypothetical protein
MTRRNLPDINPNGARYTVRVEANSKHAWQNMPNHHGTLSTAWRSVMKIADAYRAAGFHVSYSERWTDGAWHARSDPATMEHDHHRCRPGSGMEDDATTRRSYRVADIVCTPPDADELF